MPTLTPIIKNRSLLQIYESGQYPFIPILDYLFKTSPMIYMGAEPKLSFISCEHWKKKTNSKFEYNIIKSVYNEITDLIWNSIISL